ncbi:enoyl-CoA hydratase/isomerase family protein [Pseudomonas cremoricolorata]|uniref:enoyl-CoA hydratase/isomerase family protein n=1 Tax=Pseudomonas cremoricolorata TaxID=157783 RepID=UPI000424CED5|nr:enoyl-CoA hydratase/isomerase family protein [Pseudomonas cremoricolorata]
MSVLCEVLTGADGADIGVATLDAPNTLNALTLGMIETLDQQLRAWADDPNVVCVLLRGNGSKAFCAGGDVRSLATACHRQPGCVPAEAARFFAAEYTLDYHLHTYRKPLLCWAHGHVLGGGMGLLQGAGVRIVTPGSRLAMPEISIGLYPDVGASRFLGRLPGKLGLFLALTGAPINARDALDLGLADRVWADDKQAELLDDLLQVNWQEQTALQLNSLLRTGHRCASAQLPVAQWLPRRGLIDELLDVSDAPSAWRALAGLRHHPDPLLAAAGEQLQRGCPLTAHLIWEQLQRARHLSLSQTLQMDYALSLNCCRHPEFAEGVRARLIDKDHAPRWHWPDAAQVPAAVVEAHFSKVWEGRHPLADLAH